MVCNAGHGMTYNLSIGKARGLSIEAGYLLVARASLSVCPLTLEASQMKPISVRRRARSAVILEF